LYKKLPTWTLYRLFPSKFTTDAFKSLSSSFFDDLNQGLIFTPQYLEAYRVGNENDPDTSLAEQRLREALSDKNLWGSFVRAVQQETARGKDDFRSGVADIWKYSFKLLGASYFDVIYPCIEPIALDYGDKWSQRVVSEFLAGLIRGMKYWNSTAVTGVWERVLPWIKQNFDNCTPECVKNWDSFLIYVSVCAIH
jgi:hypothetical protein